MNNNVPKDRLDNFKKILKEFDKNLDLLTILFNYRKENIEYIFNNFIKYDKLIFIDQIIKNELVDYYIVLINKLFNNFNKNNFNINYKYLDKLGIHRYNINNSQQKIINKLIANDKSANNILNISMSKKMLNIFDETNNIKNKYAIYYDINKIIVETSIIYKYLCEDILCKLVPLIKEIKNQLVIEKNLSNKYKNKKPEYIKKYENNKTKFKDNVEIYLKLLDRYDELNKIDEWNKKYGNYIGYTERLIDDLYKNNNNKNNNNKNNNNKNIINKTTKSKIKDKNEEINLQITKNNSIKKHKNEKTNNVDKKIMTIIKKKISDTGLIKDFFTTKLTNFKKVISKNNVTPDIINFNNTGFYNNIKKVFGIEKYEKIKYQWDFPKNGNNAYIDLYKNNNKISHLSFHSNFKKYGESRMHIKINFPNSNKINDSLTIKCQLEINSNNYRFPILIKPIAKKLNPLQQSFINLYQDIFINSFYK